MKGQHWIEAARPKTLPAAVSPVLVGSALAANDGYFQWLPALLCLLFAVLIQIATNFANDYFDFKKGTDNENRKGPKRAVAQGWVSPKAMMIATIITLTLAFLVGVNLVWFGGYNLIIVGLLCIAFAVLYTGGPFPLAYLGLGDLFVLIFFGWIAVMYTYFVQVGTHSINAFLLGTAVGSLCVNLLVINNYRDYENDKISNKNTTVVKFGLKYGRWQYRSALIIAIAMSVLANRESILASLSCLIILPAFKIAHRLKTAESLETFNQMLKETSVILFLYSITTTILLISL